MLVLVGGVVVAVGALVRVVVGAGATGAVVVALLGEDGVAVTVVDDVEADVEPPPPLLNSTIP
jgi:UDP-N-acetylmuramoylalanine-D-glutamate ligase